MTRQVPSYIVSHWRGRSARYCVIIPVINEGTRIGRLLARMHDLGIPAIADIIIVDGGSVDGSLDAARLEEAGVAGLIVKTGEGKLSAQLRCAYAFALDCGYDGVITIDGNDKDDPSAIPSFIDMLDGGYDFVQASRYISGGKEEHTPWKRKIAIRWIHAPLLTIASGFKWTDTTQGFRAYSRRLLDDPNIGVFRDIFVTYELLAYLSYRAPKLGYSCVESPTIRRYPQAEIAPTKILPILGEFNILFILARACFGRYNPR